MKILILNNHFNVGGITSYVLNLSRGLKELGVDIIVGSCSGGAVYKLNSRHIELPLNTKSELSWKIVRSYRRLAPLLKDIDVVHANTRITQALAHHIYLMAGIPYLVTWHGYHKAKLKHRILPYWGERVIAVSNFVKNHLINDFNLNSERIRLIYNGIDTEALKPGQMQETCSLEKYGVKECDFVIGAIGRLSDVKGFDILLDAFKLFNDKAPSSVLLLAGEGKYKSKIENRILSLNLSSKVKMIGVVEDIRLIVEGLDIFVQPSLMEGLGISILEALALNVPVVATNVGGIPEIIKDGYNGILVPPSNAQALADAFIRMQADNFLRDNLSKNSRSSIAGFSYQNMASETLKAYRETTAESGY
ncbi:MAG: glycosyltransferase family 4 protein [Candidatus Omnitrophica bacterium]|nr:glycosyltransferase family 4 protein [Candidatus Omnitrophota bacterium]